MLSPNRANLVKQVRLNDALVLFNQDLVKDRDSDTFDKKRNLFCKLVPKLEKELIQLNIDEGFLFPTRPKSNFQRLLY